MIDRQEVMDFSREFGLAPNVIKNGYPCPGRVGHLVDTKYQVTQ